MRKVNDKRILMRATVAVFCDLADLALSAQLSGKRCSVAYTARPARCPQDKQAGFVLRLWIKHSITHLGTIPYVHIQTYITYVSPQESSSRCDSWPFSILSWHSALAPFLFSRRMSFCRAVFFSPCRNKVSSFRIRSVCEKTWQREQTTIYAVFMIPFICYNCVKVNKYIGYDKRI